MAWMIWLYLLVLIFGSSTVNNRNKGKLDYLHCMETRQVRRHTLKGMALYQQCNDELFQKYSSHVRDLEEHILASSDLSINNSIHSLNECRDKCKELQKVLQQSYAEYMKFLDGVKTEESNIQITWLDNSYTTTEKKVSECLKNIRMIKSDKIDTMSMSGTSEKSTSSLAISKAAEAKAAQVRVQFMEKEVELRKKQASINADIELLKHQKEAAALAAEAAELVHLSGSSHNASELGDNFQLKQQDPISKVKDYITNQSNFNDTKQSTIKEQSSDEKSVTAQFLLRKDLILSRLTNFNDTCANYQAWKASFQSVSSEMSLNSSEEIDLFIKYLGVNSKRHAISLRTAYLHDTDEALGQIWQRLDERFGSPESLLDSLTNRLQSFPSLTLKDKAKLYDLADILKEIEGLMTNPRYSKTLSYFDSSIGVNPVVRKLPYALQQKWVTHASNYKESHEVPFPPFQFFVSFVSKFSIICNDPSFNFEPQVSSSRTQRNSDSKVNGRVAAAKTGIQNNYKSDKSRVSSDKSKVSNNKSSMSSVSPEMCLIHKGAPHSLSECRNFKSKSEEEKQSFLFENRLCYKCYSPNHQARGCTAAKKQTNWQGGEKQDSSFEQGDRKSTELKQTVNNKCTEICGETVNGKSCAKIMLVHVYLKNSPNNCVKCYATLDEQSNRSLVKSELFHLLNVTSKSAEYTMSSCSGISVHSGRELDKLVVECIDKSYQVVPPTVLECHDLPSNRNEIPTPSVAANHPHLSDIAPLIPEINNNAQMLLLLGRDIPDVHHVLDQRLGPKGSPFAQRLPLGWAIIGEVCLGNTHIIPDVGVKKTYIVGDRRASLLPPCPSKIHVFESQDVSTVEPECSSTYVIDNGRNTLFTSCKNVHNLDHVSTQFTYDNVFTSNVCDNKLSLSIDDKNFLSKMSTEFVLDSGNKWSAPLPFRSPRPRLPNNRVQALQRARSLQTNLSKNPLKRQHFVEFMGKLLANGHAEIAPPLLENSECWYLPIFGVYHPKKPNKIRVVFDSSVKYEDVSLNSVLLQGPDLTNSLLGVLLRFRHESVAVSADVEQMFYCFGVHEDDRNYLRFFLA